MTTENGLLLPSTMARNIERLHRRVEFLEARIAERLDAGRPEAHNGFDRAELDALTWAIPVLEAEHLAAIRLARLVLEAAGVPEDRLDAMIASGHPR